MFRLAKHVVQIMDPPIVEIHNLLVNKEKAISFGQGVPFFHPDDEIMKQFWSKVKDNPDLHQYTPDFGFTHVRKTISRFLSSRYNTEINWSRIVLTNGANSAFFNILSVLLDPKDEVIIISPYYFNHLMAIQLLHATPVFIETSYENSFIPDIDDIVSRITQRTKAIIIVSPNNPTGMVYNNNLLNKILDVCEERNICFLFDETYSEFIYKEDKIIASYFYRKSDRIIHIGSFSKNFGLSGWRIGYLMLPKFLIKHYIKLQDTIMISPPTVSQLLVDFLIKNGINLVFQHMQDLIESRNLILRKIEESDLFEVKPSTGAFYFFVKLQSAINSTTFCKKLASEANLIIIPGNVFGKPYTQFVRFSHGTLKKPTIEKGFELINSIADKV